MRITKSAIAIFLGIVCICAGLGLTAHNLIENHKMAQASRQVTNVLEQRILDNLQAGESGELKMKSEKIGDYYYLGIIEIPRLGIKLPVMDSWSYEKLLVSPVYYSGSYYEDNFVVCAHNSYAHFGKIRGVQIGDEIHFTTVEGKVLKYIVSNTRVLQDTAVEDMVFNKEKEDNKEDWDLTLFTCTLDGQARFTVRAIKAD